jgi:hypothetical protein
MFSNTNNLNNYTGRKTYNLDDWSRIQIVIRHKKDKYDGEGYTERAEIILRYIRLDRTKYQAFSFMRFGSLATIFYINF